MLNQPYSIYKTIKLVNLLFFKLNLIKIQFIKVQKLLEIVLFGFFFQSGALFSNRYERDAHTSRDKFTTK